MENQQNHSLNEQLELVRRGGAADGFPGKRSWTRYQADMSVEVRVGESGPIESARLHNISGGGIGVWMSGSIPIGTPILARLSDEHEWLPGEVVQRSVGIEGHLLGIKLLSPLPSEHGEQRRVTRRTEDSTGQHRQHRLDVGFASLLIAMTACLPLVGPTWLAHQEWARLLAPQLAPFFVILAGLCGLVALRLVVRADRRFERKIAHTLTGIAQGHQHEMIPWAPSQAARMLRRSVIRFRDTLRQREQNERQRRQKLEELNLVKSNILSMVSHDLRTPLTSILLYSQMMREDLDRLPRAEQQQFLTIISTECTRLTRLVDDLLEAQRLDSGRTRWKMEHVDLSAPICNCADVFVVMAQSKQIELTITCPEELPPIEADTDKVSQVISNLLSNAVKYTPEGGKIQLMVKASAHELLIQVSDNGPGIPRDQWDQIFDRFSQLSATQYIRDLPGVGLGLFIVRQIVERHAGRVWVDSEPGSGSCFSVALPIQRESNEARAAAESYVARVVVCDADPETAMRIAQLLRSNRYDVRLAHSACRLLSHIEQGECDVVVTDVLLPDMDAPALIDALAARERSFRIVAHSFAGDVADLRNRGIDIVLQRPAGADELLQAVRTACLSGRDANTVLVVGNDGWRAELLRHGVSEKGWMPILVDELEEAENFLGSYPINLLLINEGQANETELAKISQAHPEIRIVMVAARKPKAETKRMAERVGFEVVGHRPGDETELLERIASDTFDWETQE